MTRLLLLLVALPLAVLAQPFIPKSDAEIVQRLPYARDAAERERLAALARNPAQLPLALATARTALDRARVQGDPRELGAAQAALAPWWARADAPAEVRLLRARLLQSQHQFDPAQAELKRLLADPRLSSALRGQALLDAAALHQLRAELPEARALCQQLQPLAPTPAAACLAELASLGPDRAAAQQAAQALAGLSQASPDAAWLLLVRAELAERLGDDDSAPQLFMQALMRQDEVYTRAAYADWLLARSRAAEALALLERSLHTDTLADADALLLRRLIAQRQLGRPTPLLDTMRERLAAADRREPGRHAREQARFALDLAGQPQEALRLARINWAMQREPADAVLLLRAARAVGGRAGEAARAELAGFLAQRGWQDARLTDLNRPLAS